MPYGIEEALTSLQATALIQKRISPVVNEIQRRYAPLLAVIPATPWNSTTFNWDTRTKLPAAGPVLDGGTRPLAQSTYVQTTVKIRNLLAVGSVTGYAEAVTSSFGSLRGRELVGALKSMEWAVETQIMAGCAKATQFGSYPQFDGLSTLCSTLSGTTQNTVDFTGATFTLAQLDTVITMVEENLAEQVSGDEWMFVISPALEKKIGQLLVKQQRFNNLPTADVGSAGVRCLTYLDIPLVKSSFLSARGGTMNAITLSKTTAGGTLHSGTHYYRVSAVVSTYGELMPCAEVSIVTTGTTSTVKIAFTPPSTPDTSPVLSYLVWRGTAAGGETLLGIVDGTVGATNNGATPILTTSIVDTGAALVPHNGTTVPAQTPTTYVAGNPAMKPQVGHGQDFYLVSRTRENICRPYVRDSQPLPNLAPTVQGPDQLPYALVTDCALGLRMRRFIGRGRRIVVNVAA